MNFDHDPQKIDEGERVNRVLDRREVAGGGVLVDSEGVGREELVLGGLEDRVLEAAHEFDPPHELPLGVLGPRRVLRWLLPGRVLGPQSLGVAQRGSRVEEEEEEENKNAECGEMLVFWHW